MDVQLWFARNEKEEIVSIIETAYREKYYCPLCGSEVIPKAKQSAKVTPHFAHLNRNECKGESIIHWWFKNKFIDVGDSFVVTTDSNYIFTCSSILTEKTFALKTGNYRPDLIVTTECGQEVIFEIANSNKKKVKNYIDKWIELNRIVVEVDIKSLINVKEAREFKALYYKGKCFNINTRDGGYYKTIGKFKEKMLGDSYSIETVKILDWFWKELEIYAGNKNHTEIFDCYEYVFHYFNKIDVNLIYNICKAHKIDLTRDYDKYHSTQIKNRLKVLGYKYKIDIYVHYFIYTNYFVVSISKKDKNTKINAYIKKSDLSKLEEKVMEKCLEGGLI